MSDPNPLTTDPVALSALLASRLCHDLVNPVGALSSGLEVLGDPDMADPDMRDAALDLIRDSATKSVALLKFARIAYGAAGAFDGDIPLDDARAAVEALYATHKATLTWTAQRQTASKEAVKILLTFLNAVAEFAPRGGDVVLSEDGAAFIIDVSSTRLFISDGFVDSLSASPASLTPKQSPVFIAVLIAQEIGATITLEKNDGSARITLDFSGVKSSSEAAALTSR